MVNSRVPIKVDKKKNVSMLFLTISIQRSVDRARGKYTRRNLKNRI